MERYTYVHIFKGTNMYIALYLGKNEINKKIKKHSLNTKYQKSWQTSQKAKSKKAK